MRILIPARLQAILLVLALVSINPVSAELWYESYDKAQIALDQGNWTEAIRQIDLALGKKDESSAGERTYGVNFTTYFPYFKLGVAYYNLGREDEALQEFQAEEAQGQIQQSADDYKELQQLRDVILQAREEVAIAEREKIDEIISDGLARASELESRGLLDEAMTALEQVLAVEPDHAPARAASDRLRNESARQQRERDLEERVGRFVREGTSEMSAGRHKEAASLFNRAVELRDTPAVRALLDEAQGRLRAELEADRGAQERANLIASGLSLSRKEGDGANYVAALDQLQSVLALDPQNQSALSMQREFLGLQARADEEVSRGSQIAGLLQSAEGFMKASDYEQALVVLARVVALDPNNGSATESIAEAYRKLSRRLLGKNLPPIVTFFDPDPAAAQQLDDGTTVEVVDSPEILLAGNVFDEGPVVVQVFQGDAQSIGEARTRDRLIQGMHITDFTLRYRLAAGFSFRRQLLTRFSAVATDDENATTQQQYAVLYLVPLHRSLWLYTGLVVIFAGVAAASYGNQRRRRNQLLTRRFNPYIAGAPVVQEKSFFGRERLLGRVLQTVHNNSILLYGERRIGKTSFQHRLKSRLTDLRDPEFNFYPVYIDLQGTPEERFFATLAEDIFHELEPLLDGIKPQAAIESGTDYQYREFVRDVRAVLNILKAKSDKNVKLVLQIDEVDELNDYDPRINQRLRSLFMKSFAENLVSVVSGVGIKKHWESEGSPWYNFFEEIEVKPFRREDAEELIEVPIRGIFDLEAGVVDRIISMTDCKPFLIQRLCVALVNRLHEENRRRITLADVESIGRPKEA